MLIWHEFDEAIAGLCGRETAITIGTFDGVHLGHQAIIRQLVELAEARALTSLVLTFAAPPAAILHHGSPPLLISLDERLGLLRELGVQSSLVLNFEPAMARLAPEAFVRQKLAALRPRVIVAGHEFRFGAHGAGNAELLTCLGRELDFDVFELPPITIGRTMVSSTAIRWMLAAGDVVSARQVLGRPYGLSATVLTGVGRGRDLGFPTANLTFAPGSLWPRYGVYLVKVMIEEAESHYGLANIGIKPTFGANDPVVEVYLLDYSGDLYQKKITVQFMAFLRPERRFPHAEALKIQIAEDVKAAKTILDRARSGDEYWGTGQIEEKKV